jgi:hypothetical protein
MAYQIRPLTVPKVFDQAIYIVKDHLGLLLSIMMMLYVPVGLVTGLIAASFMPMPAHDAPPEEIAGEFLGFWATYWPFFVVGAFVFLLVVIPITNAAIIHAISRLYLGQPVTAMEAFRSSRKQILPLIWANFLYYVVVGPGMMLCLIPGIIFSVWFVFVEQVVVIEGSHGGSALVRSKQITRNNFLATFVVWFFLFVITAGVSQIQQLIPQMHVQMLVGTVLQATIKVFTAAVVTVYYFSCRCKNENFDLHYLAQSLHVKDGVIDEVDLVPRNQ